MVYSTSLCGKELEWYRALVCGKELEWYRALVCVVRNWNGIEH